MLSRKGRLPRAAVWTIYGTGVARRVGLDHALAIQAQINRPKAELRVWTVREQAANMINAGLLPSDLCPEIGDSP